MLATAIALNRFGLGATPTDRLPGNPKQWLLDQFSRFQPRPQALAHIPTSLQVVGRLADSIAQERMDRRSKRVAQPASMAENMSQQADGKRDPRRQARRNEIRDDYLEMNSARLGAALTTETPFAERLVHFWANHFAVSADNARMTRVAGLLEFEAVRPHLLGKFSDMLLAVERHPAMLIYLDQAKSIGPNSQLGQRVAARSGRERGLNENLAREIMELHTLGVRTGYSQADVTEFARALTGWTVGGIAEGPAVRMIGGTPGQFGFAELLHEPGDRSIMGKRYSQQGEQQARAVLLDLAAAPATARHVATKLARHFAGDDPPRQMIDRLSRAFLASGGDLPTVYRALIDSPEAWVPQAVKFKTPWDWSVSALRAVGTTSVDPQKAGALFKQLGQPTWRPGSPAGWDDIAASWAAPGALIRRVEVAQRIASRAGPALDPRALGERVLPGSLSDSTRTVIARAESPQEGLALLLVSPEFVRR
jgi:uncharacterized protein (DUF1800 family)